MEEEWLGLYSQIPFIQYEKMGICTLPHFYNDCKLQQSMYYGSACVIGPC
jgi:hypothetical protein